MNETQMTTATKTMLSASTNLTKAQALPVLRAIGASEYRGRKFRLRAQAQYSINNGDLIGGGGSKTTVTFLRLRAGVLDRVDGLNAIGCPVTTGPRTFTAEIPPDVLIVEHSMFCGKDMGYTFIVGSLSNYARLAAAKTVLKGLL